MTDSITLTGLVATAPRHIVTSEGLPITSFRLASTQRRFDRSKERWIDGDTNWYTITAFRQLAINSAGSVGKGDRIIVSGRLRIREWENGERVGTNIDVEADAIGHDLMWGTSVFSRSISSTAVTTADQPAEGQAPDGQPTQAAADSSETPEQSADEESEPSEAVAALPF
ncbi:MAG: single-stranded DNA-binding protein [Rhodoglobus sp.]|nr:single-stranded DNA-binding protein [Rhodoglobus sp.]